MAHVHSIVSTPFDKNLQGKHRPVGCNKRVRLGIPMVILKFGRSHVGKKVGRSEGNGNNFRREWEEPWNLGRQRHMNDSKVQMFQLWKVSYFFDSSDTQIGNCTVF